MEIYCISEGKNIKKLFKAVLGNLEKVFFIVDFAVIFNHKTYESISKSET